MRGTVIALSVSLLLSPAMALAQNAADSPAWLATAQSFETPPLLSEVSHAEIADARREMASAVSAEKFIDGVRTVLFVALVAYLAWPDGGSSSSSMAMLAPQQPAAPAAGGGM